MLSVTSYSTFEEPLARIYNESWGPSYNKELAWPILEKLLLPYIPERANILELCCGTGQLAQLLLNKSYQVTGMDRSERMLYYARKNAPNCKFIMGDARFFELPTNFHAVFSTGLGFNHILEIEELTSLFNNVYKILDNEGIFLFDLCLEDGYKSQTWNGLTTGDINDEYAWAKKRIYHPEKKEGQVYITIFDLIEKDRWQRLDTIWLMKGYAKAEIESALLKVGFAKISLYDLNTDLSLTNNVGKVCFVCHKVSASA